MKRRAICLILVIALCLSLCPVRALAAGDVDVNSFWKIGYDKSVSPEETAVITVDVWYVLNGNSFTVLNQTAMSVRSPGRVYITDGTVESKKGTGIEVQSGGFLRIDQENVTIKGTTYGLDISAGARVELSGGEFTGNTAAIRMEGGDYAGLLVTGYAYFANGKAVQPSELDGVTTITVGKCTNHSYSYTKTQDAPTHDGICVYCGTAVEDATCSFIFDVNGEAECEDQCGHTLKIEIDPDSVVYDGEPQPDADPVTVTLDGGKRLVEGDHYTVICEPRVDVGETLITVKGLKYDGIFEKIFRVIQAAPEITWGNDKSSPVAVDYDGSPVEAADLPSVTITPAFDADLAVLQPLLYYSYKKTHDSNGAAVTGGGWTEGRLPTDAGTYQIKACLPEITGSNYTAAESAEITLKINKISPFKNEATDVPKAINLTYNGSAQKLVTGGALDPRAVGAAIRFGPGENGPWSEDIPTGINAGGYTVYYKVDGTDNYEKVDPVKIDVTIARKVATPVVELEYYTTVYDNGFKTPKVTVKDPDTEKVLPPGEYSVSYDNNQSVGRASVTVIDVDMLPDAGAEAEAQEGAAVKETGNYTIIPPEGVVAYFDITPKDQAGLTITNRPDKVVYGDVFTLETDGGSGDGTVTWEIADGKDCAEIKDASSGQVTVTGVGTFTVRATKSGTDYKQTTAECTFTSQRKSVTASVTADKTYDGSTKATVGAAVDQNDLPFGDRITITGLTGKFDSANAGTRTVTVDMTEAKIEVGGKTFPYAGDENRVVTDHYTVMIPRTAPANIARARTEITEGSISLEPTYSGQPENLVKAAAARPTTTVTNGETVVVEYALGSGGYSEAVPQAIAAGRYEVWYRVRETDNYFGTVAKKVDVTIAPKTVEATNSNVTLTPADDAYYVYDGTEKRPTVTVKDGTAVIPASEYTVTYLSNINVGAATVVIQDNAGGNYTVNGTATFEITKGDGASLTGSPQAAANLTYNGKPQNLVTVGTASGGHLEYALANERDENGAPIPDTFDGVPGDGDYQTEIPQGTDAGEYTVYYRVVGDGNHNDVAGTGIVYATIQPKTVTRPVIDLTPPEGGFVYNRREQKFIQIVVKDESGSVVIPGNEYEVTYSNNVNAGTAALHINDKRGGNYTVSGSADFTILRAEQKPFTINDLFVHYGDKFTPSFSDEEGEGEITWSVSGSATRNADGSGTVTGVGPDAFKITATKAECQNYEEVTVTKSFTVEKRPITVPASPVDREYNGSDEVELAFDWESVAFVDGDQAEDFIISGVKGKLDSPDAGEHDVTITGSISNNKYEVTIDLKPDKVTITPKEVDEPVIACILTDDGEPEISVTITATYDDALRQLEKERDYTVAISPEGWEEQDTADVTITLSGNYKFKSEDGEEGKPAKKFTVTVPKKEDPGEASQPADGADSGSAPSRAPSSGAAPSASGSGRPGAAPSAPQPVEPEGPVEQEEPVEQEDPAPSVQTSVQGGTASAVVNGDQLVDEAIENQSEAVVIRPEVAGEVTKIEVSIPASAVSRIRDETGAALTVSTPVADVTISNGALEALSGADGSVSIVTERVGNTVVLTLTADGQEVGDVPVTLTVPAQNIGPGTVAVMIYEDGTREAIRRSVGESGGVRIPLNGSATVEIVADNSREFTDVPTESWEADAVTFASAHELFNGTGEATFSPELSMSRAMLATVLYNLEGQPDQAAADGFSDVDGGLWYAAGISWAAANGIAGGYGNGRFGPNDSVTREQFAIMLWRYAGSPSAEAGALDFTDADQASDYALEALCWAVENGVLRGYGDGCLDPGGLATRAQAAQILKNFIENT